MSITQHIRPTQAGDDPTSASVTAQRSVTELALTRPPAITPSAMAASVTARQPMGPSEVSATLTDGGGAIIATISRHTEAGAAGRLPVDCPLAVVAVAGAIDQDTVCLLGPALTSAINGNDRVCCDLSRVDFFGAAGVHTLLAAHRQAAATGHRFSVRGVHGLPRRVLQITQLDTVLVVEG